MNMIVNLIRDAKIKSCWKKLNRALELRKIVRDEDALSAINCNVEKYKTRIVKLLKKDPQWKN